MSVTLETGGNIPEAGAFRLSEDDQNDGDESEHQNINEDLQGLPNEIQQDESGNMVEEPIIQDDGGGGDMQDVEKEPTYESFNEDSEGKDDRSARSTIESCSTSTGQDKKRESTNLTKSTERSEERGGLCSASSGLKIVSQILEELIVTVVDAIEVGIQDGSVTSRKETSGANVKRQEEREWESNESRKSSVTTIKSVDEQKTIAINDELEQPLSLEGEEAVLKKKQEYEENIALYRDLMEKRLKLKLRNAYLLKKMYEHYKNKKIEHLFIETPVTDADGEGKYVKLLLAFEEARSLAQEEEMKMVRQIQTLNEKRSMIYACLEDEFNHLLDKERDAGKGLIFSQTSKPITDKMIEKLLQRQISKAQEVSKHRLTYFKLRDTVSADENLLKSLQTLGDNLTLMEYEQLKMQSQSCVEKLEERDADLHRLRTKATSAIQILAEVREKSQTLLEEIEAGKTVLHDVNHQLTQTRERLGYEKKRRDMSRSDAVRLRHEAGLLSEPKLLQDYKKSIEERDTLYEQLIELKTKFEMQKRTIASIRKSVSNITRSNSLKQ